MYLEERQTFVNLLKKYKSQHNTFSTIGVNLVVQIKKTIQLQILLNGHILLSDPDRIQTCNLLIRSQMLYSVKLRGQYFF